MLPYTSVCFAAVLLLGPADLVSSQSKIYPPTDIVVPEGTSVMFSCSFSSPFESLRLSVGGLTPSDYSFVGVAADRVNKNQTLAALGGRYTIRRLTINLVEIIVTFNATRVFNGYALQCVSVEKVSLQRTPSQAISLSVECKILVPWLFY